MAISYRREIQNNSDKIEIQKVVIFINIIINHDYDSNYDDEDNHYFLK